MKKDIKIICIQTDANESIPSGAINFAELIDTSSEYLLICHCLFFSAWMKSFDYFMLYFTDVDFNLLRPHQRHPDDLAFMPFSSGTTGLPKGVMLSHNNIAVNCEQIGVRIGENPMVMPTTNDYQDVSPTVLPLFHIYGFTVLMISKLSLGVKIVTLPEFKPDTFLSTIKDHKATLLHVVPPICTCKPKDYPISTWTISIRFF